MDYDQKDSDYFKHERPEMLALMPKTCNTLLDVGCGEGTFARQIKESHGAEVWGIELMEGPGKRAEEVLDKVFIGSCTSFLKELPAGYFEVIYCNDVLEHLEDPYSFLDGLKSKLAPNGVIISSIPNIRYHSAFKKIVLQKKFEYERHGIFDKTHLRFFTQSSIAKMYTDLGFQIISHSGINKTRSLKPYLYNIPFLFTAMDMCYLQFATVATLKDSGSRA
ncbi:class I SAM-dependent methyltransferase [Maribacter sp. 2307ULW6-5]|uniref:class I SAM-dependent methyltransferase n=1 Tax=Maribacter sp. 2307ULW6-5 TaxID=3386275 RepID=UPI0039BD852B